MRNMTGPPRRPRDERLEPGGPGDVGPASPTAAEREAEAKAENLRAQLVILEAIDRAGVYWPEDR